MSKSTVLMKVEAAIGLRESILVVKDSKLLMGIMAHNKPVKPAVLSVCP
tara:strand:- start:675 stop:821 length:147 start_codon:yes stop_codon:yes gene_type:complete